jgi:DNA mismatch repair protein MutS
LLVKALVDLGQHDDLIQRLERALGADLPLIARDGGFIAGGLPARARPVALPAGRFDAS